MTKLKKILVSISVMLFVASSTVFFAFRNDDRLFEIAKNLEIYTGLYKELNALYVDEVNPTKLMRVGIQAMLKELDPYTVYYPEDMIEEYLTMNVGTYNGIGANIELHDGNHVVALVYEGSPADKAGIQVGDEVLEINGVDVSKKTAEEFGRLLKGQKGTSTKLSILKFGEKKPKNIQVERGDVKDNVVPHFGMINEEVGYVQLTTFMNPAGGREIRKAMEELKGKGMKSMVLDLRGNQGGLLQLAVEINNFFVPKGVQVVEMKGKAKDQNNKFITEKQPVDTEMPLVVLIDAKSASASEIVAGALQDLDRAVIIGQRTFGKGLVQITRNLGYNTQLKVTTAKYYIPSGRCVQAIDYSHKGSDGAFVKLPDSLRTLFYTNAGRKVYDGAGIDPDILTGKSIANPYVKALQDEYMIFNYANQYFLEHKEDKPKEGFYLTAQDVEAFKGWLGKQNFKYKTPEQKAIDNLEKEAEDRDLIKGQLKELAAVATANAAKLFAQNEDEIRKLLELEILSRYYYQNGMKFVAFERDKDVQEAVKLFKNPAQYKAILKTK